MRDPDGETLTAEQLRALAAAAGVELSPERAATLATQAKPHFALLRALDAVTEATGEPAAELRLDHWVHSDDA
jgi:hypothetical protein